MTNALLILSLVAVISFTYAIHYEEHGPAHYKFAYGVADPHTGDHHEQHEVRDGHLVKGSYSLKEADGTTRLVEYVAGPHQGFNAVVKRVGYAHHPQHYKHYGGIQGGFGGGQGGFGGQGAYWGGHGAGSHIGTTHWGYNY